MPTTSSIQQIAADTQVSDSEFLLILADKATGQLAYCLFAPGPLANTQLDGVHQLFDETMTALCHPSTIYYSESELPILTQIHQYRITVIERDEGGIVSVVDGSGEPVESHIGLG